MYLPPRETVLQSQMIHPEWTAQDHLDYLVNDAFFRLAEIDAEDALGRVAAWLAENRA